jgi:hypothetical protein
MTQTRWAREWWVVGVKGGSVRELVAKMRGVRGVRGVRGWGWKTTAITTTRAIKKRRRARGRGVVRGRWGWEITTTTAINNN